MSSADDLPPPVPLSMSRRRSPIDDDNDLPPPVPLSMSRRRSPIDDDNDLPPKSISNSENDPLSIIINGIKFTLIEKLNIDNIVVISSEINNRTIQFKVYPSTSELGLWRLCLNTKRDNRHKYKGDSKLKFDYIQTTLIHLELQRFINENLHKLPLRRIYLLTPCYEKDDGIKEMVDDQSRIIWNHAPFNKYYDKPCGVITQLNIIKEFSEEFKHEYEIDLTSKIMVIPNYTNVFENIFQITGHIFSVQLNRKTPNIDYNETNSVILYYLKTKVNKLQTNEYPEQINNICSIDTHIMPFLLTPTDTQCSELGLYTKYISTGAFICKLFDYSSDNTKQCTDEENAWGKCTKKYSYIGLRYQHIFPFNEIIDNECKNVGSRTRRRRRTRKYRNKNKKTRRKSRK